MNKLQRALCFLLALTVVCCGLSFLTPPAAKAASTAHNLATLLENGQIKPLGRTQANADGTGIMTDWSGTGFEINVNATGGMFTVKHKSSYDNYWQILLDGEYLWRGKVGKTLANDVDNGGYFSFNVPAGQHTVSIIKETQISSSDTAYVELQSLTFDGEILSRPADKDLYIEFVGDSYTCGDGSLGSYDPGVVWKTEEDSATNSYGYYAAQALGADYSLVSRGGIGLFTGESAIEGNTNKVNMTQIYPYTGGYRTSSGEYGFTRQPDAVVIWLGANDGINAADAYKTMDYWMEKMQEFAALVHQKNPNADVVFLTHQNTTDTPRYNRLLALAETLNSTWTTGRAYAHIISLHGNGTPALANQTSGHPDDGDHAIIAKELVGFLRDNQIVSQAAAQQETAWNDITYYVSASGSNSNPGTAEAPLLTIPGAFTKALADKANGTYSDTDRIVFRVSGAVVGSSTQNFATSTIIKSASGSKVPVLITTWNYDAAADNKAELKITNSYAADNAARLYATNDVTFQNVLLKSYMSTGEHIVYQFNAAGHHIVFDNVAFSTETGKAWTVAADHFATGGVNVVTATTDIYSSVTFKNGDYTGLSRAMAVGGNNIFVSSGNSPTSVPKFHCALTVGEGAQMGTVYGAYGTLQPGSVTVTIEGGTVQHYIGTNSGASGAVKTYATTLSTTVSGGTITGSFKGTGSYINFTGNISNTVSGGVISGGYMGAGEYITINGNLSNTISGGKITSTPTVEKDCIFLGGGQGVTLNGSLTNEVSGGMLEIVCNNAAIDHCIYFGCYSAWSITGDMTNQVSGGIFLMRQGTAVPTKDWNLWFGHRSGGVAGTFRNEISGGLFDIGNGGKGDYFFGSRTLDGLFGKVENIIGDPDNIGHGPRFVGREVNLAGNHGDFGGSSASAVNDTVVISNTIYGGSFDASLYCANGTYNAANIICGSVETTVYGGSFKGAFFGGGMAPVWGNITTSIYGGNFASIYGAGNSSNAPTYGNVTLNLHALEELRDATGSSNVLYAGSGAGNISGTLTLNLDPAKPGDLALDMSIYAKNNGTATCGSVSVNVNGGTFANGFTINGVTVKEALGDNAVLVNSSLQEVSFSDSDTSVSGSLVCYQKKASDEWVYYVSQDGDDRSSGRTLDSAKRTIAGVLNQAIADNGGRKTFADGVRITVYVQGKVLNGHNVQMLGIGSVLTNYSKAHMPITIVGLGSDAVIDVNYDPVNSGSASFYFANDFTLRNVDLYSETNYSATTGNYFCTDKLYAAGCQIEFDNVTLYTDGQAPSYLAWSVYADHFATGGTNVTALSSPVYSSITFKNGDYTNLANVAAVGANSIWTSANTYTEAPNLHCKIVVGEGAQMGTVTGSIGTLAVESIRVEFLGGTTQKYVGTGSGTSASSRKAYIADISVLVDGGTITGGYRGTGNNVNLTGSISNTLASGQILATSTSTANNIYFSAGDQVTITGNVTNTISGGTVKVTNGGYDSEITFGGRNTVIITGNLTNTISGGTLALDKGTVTVAGTHGIYLGNFVGDIRGTMTNTITGGTFEGTLSYPVYFGARGVDCDIGKIVNVLGSKETGEGPAFTSTGIVYLAGGWGRIGVSNHTAVPTENRDDVVISNTIYGGTFSGDVYAGTGSAVLNGAVSGYVYGGIENALYGGTFEKNLFCGCKHTHVYGDISTVIAPASPTDFVLKGTLNSGSANGDVALQVSGGHYPNGFTVSGKTVAEVLAEDHFCWVDGSVVTVSSGDTSVSGDVTVDTVAATVNGVAYTSFQEALTAAGSNGTVKLGQALEVQTLRIPSGVTLDLNGNQVSAQDVLCFGDLIDSRNGAGGITVSRDPSLAVVHLQPGNSHLPIYDTANGCYRFYEYELASLGSYTVSTDAQKFGFRILLTNASGYSLLAETEDPCLSLVVNLTVPSMEGLDITYTYTPALIRQYASNAAIQTGAGGNVTTVFTLTVKGLSALDTGDTLTVAPRITTVSGMACQGSQAAWTPAE